MVRERTDRFSPVLDCVCMCVYVCVCLCVYAWACVYMYVCACVCMYVHVCICMYVCMYVCVYVCIYICVYVCLCMCVSLCVCGREGVVVVETALFTECLITAMTQWVLVRLQGAHWQHLGWAGASLSAW